jgi:ATP phosphoribosyltransferase regulatory subunit
MNNGMDTRPIIGVTEAFGERAKALRRLQRKLLDLFAEAGFEEVIPPLVERPATLNSGAGMYLGDEMIVFSDPAGAGVLAIRPDMTPQIARIAATRLMHEKVLRLCYSGMVLTARPDSGTGSRQQWQTGLELMGEAGVDADVEVIHLAAMAMRVAGFDQPVIQVGHMGLIRHLLAGSRLGLDAWARLLARRSPEDIGRQLANDSLPDAHASLLLTMASGECGEDWLRQSARPLGGEVAKAADELLHLAEAVRARLHRELEIRVDAGLVPHFLYHSGIVFAGYAAGAPRALIDGGRYDDMMKAHGRDMPATGFSCDLWRWLDGGALQEQGN